MTLTQLRSFIAVVQHGGFTAAARALSTSQTTITSQIQTLEQEHGVELFHRRGRRVELSAVGLEFLPIARRICSDETDAAALLRDSGALQRGSLKIGAVGPFHVTEMIEAYHALHPHMHLSVALGNSETVLRDLDQYVCDVGVVARAFEDTRYFTQRYASFPVIAFVRTTHPFAKRDAITLHELAGEPLLMREPADHAPRARRRAGGCRPEAAHRDGHRQPRGAARGGRARGSASARCRRPNTCRMHGCGRCASTAIRSRPISTCAA